jgi:hypothetical protein
MSRPVYWVGKAPENCDLCQTKLESEFIDGRMINGPWAAMCTQCHKKNGTGLGSGRGQKYKLQEDGKFLNVLE